MKMSAEYTQTYGTLWSSVKKNVYKTKCLHKEFETNLTQVT